MDFRQIFDDHTAVDTTTESDPLDTFWNLPPEQYAALDRSISIAHAERSVVHLPQPPSAETP